MNSITKILISACLVGKKVRFDGKIVKCDIRRLINYNQNKILIPFCPEVSGGLPVPRYPSEIIGKDGLMVFNKKAKVVNIKGIDISNNFIRGAFNALKIIKSNNISFAILKDKSPSCGSKYIFDGTFSKTLKKGKGVTCSLLEKNSIRVFCEKDIFNIDGLVISQKMRFLSV